MSPYHDSRIREEDERGALEASLPKTGGRTNPDILERGRFCVMIFAGSGNFNHYMQRLSRRLENTPLPIESVDAKHGLVEVVINGSLYDLNDVFFRIGREFEEIIHH